MTEFENPIGSGEHGIGVTKIEYLEEELGPGTVELLRTLKQTLDPQNLFNPGKVSLRFRVIIHHARRCFIGFVALPTQECLTKQKWKLYKSLNLIVWKNFNKSLHDPLPSRTAPPNSFHSQLQSLNPLTHHQSQLSH